MDFIPKEEYSINYHLHEFIKQVAGIIRPGG